MELDVHFTPGCGLKSYDSRVPGSFVILDVCLGVGAGPGAEMWLGGRILIFFCHVGWVISQILKYRNISATGGYSSLSPRLAGEQVAVVYKIWETWNGIHEIYSHLKFYLELKTFNTTFDLIESLGWSKLNQLNGELDT